MYTVSFNNTVSIHCVREQVCFPQSKMLYAGKRLNWQSCNDARKAVCMCVWVGGYASTIHLVHMNI